MASFPINVRDQWTVEKMGGGVAEPGGDEANWGVEFCGYTPRRIGETQRAVGAWRATVNGERIYYITAYTTEGSDGNYRPKKALRPYQYSNSIGPDQQPNPLPGQAEIVVGSQYCQPPPTLMTVIRNSVRHW